MTAFVLLCAGCLGASPTDAGPDRAAYEAARVRAGRDASAHVKLALWCEEHGLPAERMKHLAIAVLNEPTNAMARGLLGMVAYRGHWKRPEQVSDQVKADADLTAALAEYNTRRAKAGNSAEAHWKLGLWCEEKGLKAEAQAHFAVVVRLDPSREAAWKRLGCKKVNGRWVTEAQVAAEKADDEAQKQADRKWKPLLTRWRGWLGDKGKREEAEKALSSVTDPRAVPSVWAVFATGTTAQQGMAVQLLGQIDASGASRALAMLAVFSDSAEVRRKATETLKRRDPRDYAGFLVALLRDPVKYEVRPVGGPGSPGALFVEGKRFNVQRLYAPPPMPYMPLPPGAQLSYDANGLPVYIFEHSWNVSVPKHQTTIANFTPQQFMSFHPTDPAYAQAVQHFWANSQAIMNGFWNSHPKTSLIMHRSIPAHQNVISFALTENASSVTPKSNVTEVFVGRIMAEYQTSAAVAQQQLAGDIAAVQGYNAGVKESNERVAQVLGNATGQQDLGAEREGWKKWWTNLQGYAYFSNPDPPRPTVVENVPLAYLPQSVPTLSVTVTGPTQVTNLGGAMVSPVSSIASCFGAGTPVRTLTGMRAIETLRVGDQVLTQDLNTGALTYQPVVLVHHNPPSPTFLIRLAGETIVSSPFHRFWKVGQGWVMARDLKAGDTLRLLDGQERVESVEAGKVQLVYNLDVAEDHDFFAGARGALVHDNTLPDLRLAPFDAAPSLAAVAERSR